MNAETTTVRASAAPWRAVLLVLVAASLAHASASWIDDGVTPSFVVYPLVLLVLLVGLCRLHKGGGTLYFGNDQSPLGPTSPTGRSSGP